MSAGKPFNYYFFKLEDYGMAVFSTTSKGTIRSQYSASGSVRDAFTQNGWVGYVSDILYSNINYKDNS
jgi:hypothetical protein|tara:strand:+ start:387 stop:590 length:204 start_codon:yes stop_codon:yes gene_type:complete